MRSSTKGQIAYEFLILFFVLLIAFTLWTVLSSEAKDRLEFQRNEILIQDLGLGLQHQLYTAAQMSDGFSRNLTIPKNLEQEEYNVSLDNETGWLTIQLGGLEASYTIPDMSVPHELEKAPKTNTINKTGGRLVINEVAP